MRRGCFIWLLVGVGVPFALLIVLAVFAELTCPQGADCSIDPTEQSMAVRILNDTTQSVIVDQLSCPRETCEHEVVAPAHSIEAGTSDRGAENLYRVKDLNEKTLGCFPLLYFRRPVEEPTLHVSQASQCLTITNDTKDRVLVEVRCDMDCDFEQDAIVEPAQAIMVGASAVRQYRVSKANGPSFWPSAGRLLGYAPDSTEGATAAVRASALVP